MSKSKTKNKASKSTKRELLDSVKENDDVKITFNSVHNSQETIDLVRRYEDIMKTQNKKAIAYIAKQGQLFKMFKDTHDFFDNVSQSKLTIF